MHLTTRNVNTAFRKLVGWFHRPEWYRPVSSRPSRNGPVLVIDEPVTVTYTCPAERVLFNPARDANPFFHLYEALWMLAGRNDVAPLAYYNKRMAEFSDDGTTLNGAYGYRWRHARPFRYKNHPTEYATVVPTYHDQLDVLVSHLRADPGSRRAVLQMWNVEDDLLKIDGGGPDATFSKDVCCNLSVMFSLREAYEQKLGAGLFKEFPPRRALDMTVTNRSNDLLWGLLGANYVQFTILQEYVAARLGAAVGRYHHISNNLHVYADRPDWRPAELLAEYDEGGRSDEWYGDRAEVGTVVPLVKDPAAFEAELPRFVERHASAYHRRLLTGDFTEPFLRDVAGPLLQAWHYRRDDPAEAERWVGKIVADDWRLAARDWLARRAARRAGKADRGAVE